MHTVWGELFAACLCLLFTQVQMAPAGIYYD